MNLAVALLLPALAAPDSCEDRVDALEARVAQLEAAAAPAGPADDGLTVPAGSERDAVVSLTGPVDVRGHVRGEVVAVGGDVRLHPGSHVEGDAVSLGGQVVQLGDARLDGDAITVEAPGPAVVAHEDGPAPAQRAAWWMGIAGVAVLVGGLWPGRVENTAAWLRAQPLRAGVLGLAAVSSTLSVALVLGITIIGLPVGMALVAALGAVWLLGFTALGHSLGGQLPGLGARRGWAPVLVGVGLVAALSTLSGVGPLLFGLLAMPAVGAALASRFGARPPDGSVPPDERPVA